ncbi:hypothetical protein THRCLA_05155 [Thraustotheca clavata]|uniref:Transmembrane protein n=1 Tax=Thraustotheca clavata TaxID=74557 RepID=A0A1V9ZWX3_9STRA|nr:hypothetical protein THRCLA_05155 [Thraustotheca clavata]
MIPSPRASTSVAYHVPNVNEDSLRTSSMVVMQPALPRMTIPLSTDEEAETSPSGGVLVWYISSSCAIAAVFLCTLVFADVIGMHFLCAFIVALLNYEMTWYSAGIRQKILRPFQLYYEPDALAASRENIIPLPNISVWASTIRIPSPILAAIIALLTSVLCGGSLSIIQHDGGLGLDLNTFLIMLSYITSTCFVSVIAALYTPTAMDGVILLFQQAAFSIQTLNSLLDFRAPVNGKVRSIKLIDAGFALSITFVPIVILRIVRSREVARTGVTLMLDLFTLQYVPSLLNVVLNVVQDFLNPDQLNPNEVPNYRLYALISCFLMLWTTDLCSLIARHLLPQRPPWIVVAIGMLGSMTAVALFQYTIVPVEIPNLCKVRHHILAALSAFVYHVGFQFVAVLRFLALPSNHQTFMHSTWLVRLQFILLFGFMAMLYERFEWPSDYSYTSSDVSNQIVHMWQRIDNASYSDYLLLDEKLNFMTRLTKFVKVIHLVPDNSQLKQWSSAKLHQMVSFYGAQVLRNITNATQT